MKKKVIVLLILFIINVNVFAQTAFDYLRESLVNVLTFSSLLQVGNYDYKDGGNALWGTYLEPGKTIYISTTFDAGVEYLIFASGHTKMANIGLKVYRGQGTGGTVIAKDTTPDAMPVVRFTPAASGWHCFEVLNSGKIPAFVSLVILKYKRNANFNLKALLEALQNTLDLSEYLAAKLPPDSEIPANKWTLFGGNVNRGSAAAYYDTILARGEYVLVGAGEHSVTNCDVEVIEQYAAGNISGKKVSQNTDSQNPFDIASFTPNTSKRHYLKVINQNSRNPSSFMFGFLILIK